jgi:hypothetical protein
VNWPVAVESATTEYESSIVHRRTNCAAIGTTSPVRESSQQKTDARSESA